MSNKAFCYFTFSVEVRRQINLITLRSVNISVRKYYHVIKK